MALDYISTAGGILIPAWTRTDPAPASGAVKVPESLASFLSGTLASPGSPTQVTKDNPLPAMPPALALITGTLTASGQAVTWAGGYSYAGVVVDAAGAASTTLSTVVEISPDGGTTWYTASSFSVNLYDPISSQAYLAPGLSYTNGWSSSRRVWYTPVPPGFQVRVRCSSYTSGTLTVTLSPCIMPPGLSGYSYLGNTSSVTATVSPPNQNGLTPFRHIAAANTTPVAMKSSGGRLYSAQAWNNTASARWWKLYQKSSSPTVGTDTPLFTLLLPANWSGLLVSDSFGVLLQNQSWSVFTTGYADTDTNAPAAGDCGVNASYN